MNGALMSLSDRLLLRKRAMIEIVNDELEILHSWNIQCIGLLAVLLSTS